MIVFPNVGILNPSREIMTLHFKEKVLSCQTSVCKSFSDRETVDMKAVVNDYKSSYEIIDPGNCDMLDK